MNKKQKSYIIAIVAVVISIPLVYHFSPLYHLAQFYGKFDSDIKHVVVTIIVAVLGGLLFLFRNKTQREVFELFEVMELLLLIVIPSVVIFEYIMNTPTNYSVAIAIYFAGIGIWFPFVMKRHKIIADPKKEKAFTGIVVYIFAMLVVFGLFAFWQLTTFNQFLQDPP